VCGITGLVAPGNQSFDLDVRLGLSRDQLLERGPDGSGDQTTKLGWGFRASLGHTRLAIIDLTDAGLQPFVSQDAQYLLTFNGEIYNYIELRRELETAGVNFHTATDTEVLFQALIFWGEAALGKLEGMFAFAFVDKANDSILLARDPFGIKPIYYHLTDSSLGFASEPRALRKLFPHLNSVNEKVASDFLVLGYCDLTENTFFEGIRSVLPGHYLKVSLKQGHLDSENVKYWLPEPYAEIEISFDDAQKTFRDLLFESVELHMRSDVAVGAALSGGLDSSSIVSVVRHLYPKAGIHTFSYIANDPRISEEAWVDQIVAWTGSKGHKVSISSDALFERDLDELIHAQGEPFPTLSIYAQFKVFQLAKENGIKVTLDGQGADELLAGYQGYPDARLASLIESGDWTQIPKFLAGWKNWPGRSLKGLSSDYLANSFPALRRSPIFISLAQSIGVMGDQSLQYFEPNTKRLAGVSTAKASTNHSEFKGRRLTEALLSALGTKGLTPLLRYADRNSMHSSIESRVPFLNKKLVEFTLSLPENYLLSNGGETKHILRKSLEGIVPDSILNRKDKIGFAAETNGLGKGSQMLAKISASLDSVPLINRNEAKLAIEDVVSGNRALDSTLWRLVNFSRWHQIENVAS